MLDEIKEMKKEKHHALKEKRNIEQVLKSKSEKLTKALDKNNYLRDVLEKITLVKTKLKVKQVITFARG